MSNKEVIRLNDYIAAGKHRAIPEKQTTYDLRPATPLLLGQYKIIGTLDANGFTITYLAQDSLKRRVMIQECFPALICTRDGDDVKALSPKLHQELSSIVDEYLNEAEQLAKISHTNVARIHHAFRENSTAYMALDFVEGQSLIEADGAAQLSVFEIMRRTIKTLGAIKTVHDNGLLHGDISPDKIKVDADGEPILVGFGATGVAGWNDRRQLSNPELADNTYLPPEFYHASRTQGPYSDLYSFAASIYHLIVGTPPASAETRVADLVSLRNDPYVPLAGNHPEFPDEFLSALDTALSVYPANRFQSADDWLEVLATMGLSNDSVFRHGSLTPVKQPDDPPNKEVAAVVGTAPPAKRTFLVSALGVALLALCGLSALMLASTLSRNDFSLTALLADPTPPVIVTETADQPVPPFVEGIEVASLFISEPPNATAAPLVAPPPTGEGLPSPQTPPEPRQSVAVETVPAPLAVQQTSEFPLIGASQESASLAFSPGDAPVEGALPIVLSDPTPRAPSARPGPLSAPNLILRIAALGAVAADQAQPAAAFTADSPPKIGGAAPLPTVEVERFAQADTPPKTVAPAIAERQVIVSHWDVKMPFASETAKLRNANVINITDVSERIPNEWAAEGVTIFALNNAALPEGVSLESMILSSSPIDPDGFARASVRYRSPDTDAIARDLLTVPIIRQIGLADGAKLEARVVDGGWAVFLVEPGSAATTLQVGDMIVQERETDTAITGHEALQSAMETLIKEGIDTAEFTVLRDGELVTVTYALTRHP